MSNLEMIPRHERRGSASDRDISYNLENHDTLSVYSAYSNYSDRSSVIVSPSPRESRLTNRSSKSFKVVPMVLPDSTKDDFEPGLSILR